MLSDSMAQKYGVTFAKVELVSVMYPESRNPESRQRQSQSPESVAPNVPRPPVGLWRVTDSDVGGD